MLRNLILCLIPVILLAGCELPNQVPAADEPQPTVTNTIEPEPTPELELALTPTAELTIDSPSPNQNENPKSSDESPAGSGSTLAIETAVATTIEDCIQWHIINPNEERLQQITDWLNLDLQIVAAINSMDSETPLVAGEQLCLRTVSQSADVQPKVVAPDPQPTSEPMTVDRGTTVMSSVVDVHTGPSFEHPIVGQLRAGDLVQVTGLSADGWWLQILYSATSGEYGWILYEMTNIGYAKLETLVRVEAPPLPPPPVSELAPDFTSAPDPPTFSFEATPPWPTPVPATHELTVWFSGSAFDGQYHLLPHWSKRPIDKATGNPIKPEMSFSLLIEPGNVRVPNVDGGETILWPRVRSVDVFAVLEEAVDCADVSSEDWSIIEDVSIVGRTCEALPSVGERWFLTYYHPYPLESDPGYNNYDPCTRPEPISYIGSDYNLTLIGALHAAPVGINSLGVGGLGCGELSSWCEQLTCCPAFVTPLLRIITTTPGKLHFRPTMWWCYHERVKNEVRSRVSHLLSQ